MACAWAYARRDHGAICAWSTTCPPRSNWPGKVAPAHAHERTHSVPQGRQGYLFGWRLLIQGNREQTTPRGSRATVSYRPRFAKTRAPLRVWVALTDHGSVALKALTWTPRGWGATRRGGGSVLSRIPLPTRLARGTGQEAAQGDGDLVSRTRTPSRTRQALTAVNRGLPERHGQRGQLHGPGAAWLLYGLLGALKNACAWKRVVGGSGL